MNEIDALQPGAETAGDRRFSSPLFPLAAFLAVVIGSAVVLSTPHDRYFTPPMHTYTTLAGERITLRLGDGSRIMLAPRSEVRVPVHFPDDARDVRLAGAAYFEVAPDADRPFRVHAGGTVTRVVGTRFVVRAYAGDEEVEVGVEDGSVAVRGDEVPEDDALHLVGGQVARVDPAGKARVLAGAGLDAALAWTAGRIVFRDRPLHEIARELERWYPVKILILDPGLATRALTLSFQNAALEDILGVIAASLDARYRISGATVTLSPASATMYTQ